MRVLLKATFPVEAGNRTISDGSLPKTLQSIIGDLKPEAAYFVAEDGKRAALLFLNINDASEIPAIAEPFFLAVNASVSIVPVMNADDLAKAGPSIERAVKKYGGAAKAHAV